MDRVLPLDWGQCRLLDGKRTQRHDFFRVLQRGGAVQDLRSRTRFLKMLNSGGPQRACDARLDDTLLGCLQRGIRFRCQRHRLCNRLR